MHQPDQPHARAAGLGAPAHATARAAGRAQCVPVSLRCALFASFGLALPASVLVPVSANSSASSFASRFLRCSAGAWFAHGSLSISRGSHPGHRWLTSVSPSVVSRRVPAFAGSRAPVLRRCLLARFCPGSKLFFLYLKSYGTVFLFRVALSLDRGHFPNRFILIVSRSPRFFRVLPCLSDVHFKIVSTTVFP